MAYALCIFFLRNFIFEWSQGLKQFLFFVHQSSSVCFDGWNFFRNDAPQNCRFFNLKKPFFFAFSADLLLHCKWANTPLKSGDQRRRLRSVWVHSSWVFSNSRGHLTPGGRGVVASWEPVSGFFRPRQPQRVNKANLPCLASGNLVAGGEHSPPPLASLGSG